MVAATSNREKNEFDDTESFRELFALLQQAQKTQVVAAKCAVLSFLSMKATALSRKLAATRRVVPRPSP